MIVSVLVSNEPRFSHKRFVVIRQYWYFPAGSCPLKLRPNPALNRARRARVLCLASALAAGRRLANFVGPQNNTSATEYRIGEFVDA